MDNGDSDARAAPRAAGASGRFRSGAMDRRSVSSPRATALGLARRCSPGRRAGPRAAQDHRAPGRTLRRGDEARPLGDPAHLGLAGDPRISDAGAGSSISWSYRPDGTFRGMLLESWAVNDEATEYVPAPRDGVTGEPLRPFTGRGRWRSNPSPAVATGRCGHFHGPRGFAGAHRRRHPTAREGADRGARCSHRRAEPLAPRRSR